MLDLRTASGLNSYGLSVGYEGEVVGSSEVESEVSNYGHAFHFTSGSGILDLNSLINPLSPWELLDADDINDAGQITGQGLINDQYHAFLLTPAQPGDYNANGIGGPEYYDLWKANFGSTTLDADDGNGNCIVDAADFTV